MRQNDAYEHIRQIKEIVVDNGSLTLVPRAILLKTIFFSSIMSILNFGITPVIFSFEAMELWKKLLLTAIVTIGSTAIFYFYILRILQNENDRLQRPYTKNQRFIGEIFTAVTAVGTTMSLTVTTLGGYTTVFFYWIAFVGLALFALGHYTQKAIKLYGGFMIFAGVFLTLFCAVYFAPQGIGLGKLSYEAEIAVYRIGQISGFLISGIGQLGLWAYLRGKKNV